MFEPLEVLLSQQLYCISLVSFMIPNSPTLHGVRNEKLVQVAGNHGEYESVVHSRNYNAHYRHTNWV